MARNFLDKSSDKWMLWIGKSNVVNYLISQINTERRFAQSIMMYLFLTLIVVAIPSCVLMDSDNAISKFDRKSLFGESVSQSQAFYFKNNASYVTISKINNRPVAKNHLNALFEMNKYYLQDEFGEHDFKNLLVKIEITEKENFSVAFIDDELGVIAYRHYDKKRDFDIGKFGEIVIKEKTHCGAHDSPGVGCMWSSNRFFINEYGDLVVIQSSGGTGLATILPVWTGMDYFSIFPRVKNLEKNQKINMNENMEKNGAVRAVDWVERSDTQQFSGTDTN